MDPSGHRPIIDDALDPPKAQVQINHTNEINNLAYAMGISYEEAYDIYWRNKHLGDQVEYDNYNEQNELDAARHNQQILDDNIKTEEEKLKEMGVKTKERKDFRTDEEYYRYLNEIRKICEQGIADNPSMNPDKLKEYLQTLINQYEEEHDITGNNGLYTAFTWIIFMVDNVSLGIPATIAQMKDVKFETVYLSGTLKTVMRFLMALGIAFSTIGAVSYYNETKDIVGTIVMIIMEAIIFGLNFFMVEILIFLFSICGPLGLIAGMIGYFSINIIWQMFSEEIVSTISSWLSSNAEYTHITA